ncbi:MAG: hypothetical protein ACO1NS_08300 [Daejeonella sp.]
MTKIFLLAIMLCATNAFGQTVPGLKRLSENQGVVETSNSNDTTLKVLYIKKSTHKIPAYYINGHRVNEAFVHSINPNMIDGIQIHKENVEIGSVMYYGQVYITTKKHYAPKLISLSKLKAKYNILKGEPAIFILDGEVVTEDFDNFVVDENLLWRIIIDKVENENINMKFIKLLTNTDENRKKANKINIRGTEVAMTK